MKNLKSFTLIELLVVIVIIGILSGLVVVATTSFVNSTSNAKLVAELSTLAKTLETQASYPKGSFCLEDTANSQGLLDALGMAKPPKHPSYSAGDTNNCFLYFSDGNHYSIRVNTLGNKGILVQESRNMKTAGIKDKCEEGWIPFGNRCIMKYEAKKVNVGGVDVATSQPAGTPWVAISWYDAKAKCEAIGAHLITNAEWMAIARDIEATKANWKDGQMGTSGQINRGHSDNGPSNALTVSNVNDSYNQTNNSSTNGWEQKRTHTLSNGEVIWDFAGNVWEWVDRTITTQTGMTPAQGWDWQDIKDVGWGNTGLKYEEVGALNKNLVGGTNGNNIGIIYYKSSDNTLRAFTRGGYWNYGASAGVFTLRLNPAPGSTGTTIGFRCARY